MCQTLIPDQKAKVIDWGSEEFIETFRRRNPNVQGY
jgi:hypothetical protein